MLEPSVDNNGDKVEKKFENLKEYKKPDVDAEKEVVVELAESAVI